MQTAGIIIGAGFIGSYVIQKFRHEANTVKVSVTDLAKPEIYQHLHQLSQFENRRRRCSSRPSAGPGTS